MQLNYHYKINRSCFKQHSNKSINRLVRGFSLLELMIAGCILAILAGLAAPSLQQVSRDAQVRAHSFALQSVMGFARRHALSNFVTVHICQKADQTSDECENNYQAGRSWSSGWIVFADINQNNRLDAGETVKVHNGTRATQVVFNQRGRLRFFSDGSARSAGFYICADGAKKQRHVSVLHSGRVRIRQELPDRAKGLCKSQNL